MSDSTLLLQGLSSVSGKEVDARFDGGVITSDIGVLALREIEKRLKVTDCLTSCIKDLRCQDLITHSYENIIRFRVMMIAAGYEDGNDADYLRFDPAFKMALDKLPSDDPLASQPTISRLENRPNRSALLRMALNYVEFYCDSFSKVPGAITLDFDDTFDAVHGQQEQRKFNAHYNDYGFQPIVVFDDDGRFVTAWLRPAKRPSGKEVRAMLRLLLKAIRSFWPKTQILIRGDSHYCSPEVISFCRENGLDFLLGLAPTKVLKRRVKTLEDSTLARFEAGAKEDKVRRFTEFYDGAQTWARVERIIARVEVGEEGPDTRFIVTNIKNVSGKTLYEKRYCRRGQAENHIKSYKTHLASDRTSCMSASANQFRLFLHAAAYWLMWQLRSTFPKKSSWRTRQFDTLHLCLIKVAAKVVEYGKKIRLSMPDGYPYAETLQLLLLRMPKMLT